VIEGCPMDECWSVVKHLRRHLREWHHLSKAELDRLAPSTRRGRANIGKDPRSRGPKVIFLHYMARVSIILWIPSTYTVCININLYNFVHLNCHLWASVTTRLAAHLVLKHGFSLCEAKMVSTRPIMCCSNFSAKLKHPAANDDCVTIIKQEHELKDR